jgi:hypothetical protein
MTSQIACERNDSVQRPISALFLWCLPLRVGFGANLLSLPPRAVAFAWMGAGRLMNTHRCHQLHCYIAGPVFLVGAIFAGLFSAAAALSQHYEFG